MHLSNNPVTKVRCITNNRLVKEHYPGSEFYEVGMEGLFLTARKLILEGHALLSHPLYGNIRPDVGPYKSILLDLALKPADLGSLQRIASAITYVQELEKMHQPAAWDAASLRDFQEIDLSILRRALDG